MIKIKEELEDKVSDEEETTNEDNGKEGNKEEKNESDINYEDENKWRLLITSTDSYKEQMAIDEANMLSVKDGKSQPILRFCYFKIPSVSIGFFQSVKKEVNVELCEKGGIEIFRRMTGGGAVFKDPKKELNYSFIIREDDEKIPLDILESYKKICGAIVLGLREWGIPAEFKPINDIIVHNKKISGNAQTRKNGILLQHGTILLDVDIDKMFSVLKINDEKIKDKIIKNARDRVTSISKEVREKIGMEELQRAITRGFEKTFNVQFKLDELTKEEKKKTKELYDLKYNTNTWNFWK